MTSVCHNSIHSMFKKTNLYKHIKRTTAPRGGVLYTQRMSRLKRIINRSRPTKTPNMVSLSLIGFKLMRGREFFAPCHCDLDLWPTNPKINIDHPWVMTIHDTIKALPMWNNFEVNERTRLFLRRTNGKTDGQTDDVRHNKIRSKVPSGV